MAIYLKNSDLLRELKKSKELDNPTPLLCDYIILMANKIAYEFRYEKYEDYEDCRGDAILNVMNYWRTFTEDKSTNAFSWMTQTIKTGYGIGYNKIHKKRKNKKNISIDVLHNSYNI